MTTKRQKNWKYRHKGTTKRHKTTTETQKYCKETQKNHNGRHRDHKTTTGTQMYHKETQNEYRDTKQLQRHQSAINHKKETKKLAQRHTWQLQSVLKTTTQRHVTTTKRQEMALKRRCGVLGVNEGLGDLLHVCAQGPVVSWSRPRLWGVMRCGGAERGWGGGGDSLIKACLSLDLFTPARALQRETSRAARPLAFHLADEGEHWCRGFPCGFSFHGAGVKYERGAVELTRATRGSSQWEQRTQKMSCSGSSSGPSCLQHKSIESSD